MPVEVRPTPAVQGGSDANYVHAQAAMSDVWDIAHPLGKFPSVTIVDSGANKVEGEVLYIDSGHLRVQFNAPFSGLAYLN